MELLLQVGTFCVAVGALVAGMPFKRDHEYPNWEIFLERKVSPSRENIGEE